MTSHPLAAVDLLAMPSNPCRYSEAMSARRHLCDLQHPGSEQRVSEGFRSEVEVDALQIMTTFMTRLTPSSLMRCSPYPNDAAVTSELPLGFRRLARCVESKNISELTMVLREALELKKSGVRVVCGCLACFKDQGTQ